MELPLDPKRPDTREAESLDRMPESSTRYDRYSLRILDVVAADRAVTQRSLARDLGIALGLTNLLIKRLVRKGWMRVTHISPNRVRYLITPAGIVEKSRMSRDYLEASVQFYREARDRVKQRFLELSTTWPTESGPSRDKRIVFLGANEVAEISYVCLAETDLVLVGVVDGTRTEPFFGRPVCDVGQLRGGTMAGLPYDRLVVMSFCQTEQFIELVDACGLPEERVFWL